MAYGMYRLALESGIRIPTECSVVGVDDNNLNAWIAPWLSSVNVPYKDFGGKVLDQLRVLWAGEQPDEQLLPHRLIVR
jgi:LacI family transcriptional regulator